MLNIYFGSMVEALVRHGLKLDKFIGDGLLAYADASLDPADAALRGLRAARDMAVSLRTVNVKLASRNLPEIRFGVGLHMGPVVIGNIGSPEKMQYTVIGDTVNTAARLEPLSKKYSTEIVLSEIVWSLLPDAEKKLTEFINEEELKGLRGPVKVYAVKSGDVPNSVGFVNS
jgi:adenylate cyclase